VAGVPAPDVAHERAGGRHRRPARTLRARDNDPRRLPVSPLPDTQPRRRHVSNRPSAPRRRCRARLLTGRGPRHEHRAARRAQPVVEARAGLPRRRRRCPARQLRLGAPPGSSSGRGVGRSRGGRQGAPRFRSTGKTRPRAAMPPRRSRPAARAGCRCGRARRHLQRLTHRGRRPGRGPASGTAAARGRTRARARSRSARSARAHAPVRAHGPGARAGPRPRRCGGRRCRAPCRVVTRAGARGGPCAGRHRRSNRCSNARRPRRRRVEHPACATRPLRRVPLRRSRRRRARPVPRGPRRRPRAETGAVVIAPGCRRRRVAQVCSVRSPPGSSTS
jgi:hypothetical protein